MKRSLILSLAAALLLGSALVFAQPQKNNERGTNWGNRGFDGLRVQTMLKLTDEQSVKFNDIKYNHQLSVVDIKSEIQKNRIEVKKMMADNKIESDKLLQLTNANSELQGKIKTSKTQMWLDVYNILNDDQKETWTKTFNRFGQREGRKGFRSGHGFGKNNCMGNGKPGYGSRNSKGYNQQ